MQAHGGYRLLRSSAKFIYLLLTPQQGRADSGAANAASAPDSPSPTAAEEEKAEEEALTPAPSVSEEKPKKEAKCAPLALPCLSRLSPHACLLCDCVCLGRRRTRRGSLSRRRRRSRIPAPRRTNQTRRSRIQSHWQELEGHRAGLISRVCGSADRILKF